MHKAEEHTNKAAKPHTDPRVCVSKEAAQSTVNVCSVYQLVVAAQRFATHTSNAGQLADDEQCFDEHYRRITFSEELLQELGLHSSSLHAHR